MEDCAFWGATGISFGPTLFLIFINDLDIAVEITGALVKKFADDTKCYMVVETEEDKIRFQAMLNNLKELYPGENRGRKGCWGYGCLQPETISSLFQSCQVGQLARDNVTLYQVVFNL